MAVNIIPRQHERPGLKYYNVDFCVYPPVLACSCMLSSRAFFLEAW